MKLHPINYRKAGGAHLPGLVSHRGWWFADVPRLLPRCARRGHRPVVDGPASHPDGGQPERWVRCGRCGQTPIPRGRLNAATWRVGAPYTGRWMPPLSPGRRDPDALLDAVSDLPYYPPGEFPAPVGDFHLETVIGRCVPAGFSAAVTVGGSQSDEAVSLTVRVHRTILLHLSATAHGRALQHLLNPRDDERSVSLSLESGRLRWECWLPNRVGRAAWWQRWTLPLNPVDTALGIRETRSGPLEMVHKELQFPNGETRTVRLALRRSYQGRRFGPQAGSWLVTWEHRPGIPTRADSREALLPSSVVGVSDSAARSGTWPQEAAAAIVDHILNLRAEAPAAAPAPGAEPAPQQAHRTGGRDA